MKKNNRNPNLLSPAINQPIKCHGGKGDLAGRIIGLFPTTGQDYTYYTYYEPFCYGAAVWWKLAPGFYRQAALNDINPEVINFYEILRDHPAELLMILAHETYTQATFQQYLAQDPAGLNKVWRAVRFIVLHRMSRGGLCKTFAWSDRLRGGVPGDLNAWRNALMSLGRASRKLQGVILTNWHFREAFNAIRDNPYTMTYLDPPYLPEVRSTKKAYAFEMTPEEHQELLGIILTCKGKVAISHYRCDMYDTALAGWNRSQWEVPNNAGQSKTKQRRVECLWRNYE